MEPIQIHSAEHLVLQISQQIHDHGWALIAADYGGVLYNFTVGVEYSWGHQNLEVFGLDEHRARAYLENLVGRIQSGKKLRAGDFISDLAEGYDLFLVENPADPSGPPITGGRLRLVWPDARSRYPWDADCEDHCALQTYIPPICGIDLEGLHRLVGVLGQHP